MFKQATTPVKKRTTQTSQAEIQLLDIDTGKSSFLAKLYSILSNQDIKHIVSWNEKGDQFQIYSSAKFQNEVIPMYFKHKNLKSFIRQLNLHGFKKLRNKGKFGRDAAVDLYKHDFFRMDQPDLMGLIKRKIAKPAEVDEKSNQINSLIEKQKELQEKVRIMDQLESVDYVQMISKASSDKNLGMLLEAFKVFQQFDSKKADSCQKHIFKLTEEFLQNLGHAHDKAFSDEFLTAPSTTAERDEDRSSLLAKRSCHDQWDSVSDSGFDSELESAPHKILDGDTLLFCENAIDVNSLMNRRIGQSSDDDVFEAFLAL